MTEREREYIERDRERERGRERGEREKRDRKGRDSKRYIDGGRKIGGCHKTRLNGRNNIRIALN